MRSRAAVYLVIGALCVPPAAWGEGMGSPSGIVKKGKWVMGLGGGSSTKELSGSGEATTYGVAHYRGYGVTDWLTAYVKIGGAYVEIEDPSIITTTVATAHNFGGNILSGVQLKARLWQKPDWGVEWNGAVRYTDIRAKHREKNEIRWHHWQLATSFAKSMGKFTPYLGLSYSKLDVDYKIRQNGRLLASGSYREDQPVDLFFGTDYILGDAEDASVNVEGSLLNGGEVNVAVQYLF